MSLLCLILQQIREMFSLRQLGLLSLHKGAFDFQSGSCALRITGKKKNLTGASFVSVACPDAFHVLSIRKELWGLGG